MDSVLLKRGVALITLFALIGCGSPGVPLPPSLELARPVSDLRAVRKGNTVYLSWTASEITTDRHNIRHPGPTEICRAFGTTLKECGAAVGQVPFVRPAPGTKGAPKRQLTYSDQLPAGLLAENPAANLVYAVSELNSYGKTAGLSNPVQVSAAPTSPPPNELQAQVSAEGVRLNWQPVTPRELPGVRYVYRIYRREAGTTSGGAAGEVELTGEVAPSWLDPSFAWEKTYEYRVTVVTIVGREAGNEPQVEGDDSPAVIVVAHDVFPPAVPGGLQAVFSGPGQKPFIDLIWAPVTDADLAGYVVYRHEQDGPPVKLAPDLVKTPTFRDSGVLLGHQYSYSVSAVDVRGNESARSEEATEAVPLQ